VRTVELRVETRGSVAEIMVEKGALVSEGDVILQLSQDDRLARLRQAKALLEQRQIEYEASSTLSSKGYRSDTNVAETRARLEEAKAAVAAMEIDIDYTTVRAPFDGFVDARPVEIGDFLEVGDPVATIVDLDPILVVGQVSERDVEQITVGQRATARMISGDVLDGTIRYVSTMADETTRTFRVELEIPNPSRRVVQGVSSELHLALAPLPAHLVSPAILTLADDGTLGVKLVNDEEVVEFHPATIVADGPEGVWLAGLPREATFITVGQEFVTAGQKVEAMPETGAPAS
jgi:multidrug efflux system membrane fusion protein